MKPRPPQNLREMIQSEMIHSFILGLIEPFTAEDFKNIIDKNINIFKVFNIDAKSISGNGIVNKIIGIINENKDRIDEYLNVDSMLDQMQDHRPDLYAVFNTKKGRAYLENIIVDIRKFLNELLK